MNKYIGLVLLLLTAFISACASNEKSHVPETVIETQEVKMPVPVWREAPKIPELKDIENIVLPIDSLNKDSTNKEVASAYANTIIILQNELKYRTVLLKAYGQVKGN